MKMQLSGICKSNRGSEMMGDSIVEMLKDRYGDDLSISLLVRRKWKSEADVIFDSSGFSYGDKWGGKALKKSEISRKLFAKQKKAGCKTIFMPQTVGSFHSKGLAESFKSLMELSDLAFVRDSYSLAYAQEVAPECDIQQFPDFTFDYKPTQSGRFEKYRNGFCLIPNRKLATHDKYGEDDCIGFFKEVLSLVGKESNPYFATFEDDDKFIAEGVNKDLGLDIPIIMGDPRKVTEAVSVARSAISFRFHGLIRVLNYCIPTITCGWAHKYRGLFEDFDIEDCYMENLEDVFKVKLLLNKDSHNNIKDRIAKNLEIQKDKMNLMWDKIFNLIEKTND